MNRPRILSLACVTLLALAAPRTGAGWGEVPEVPPPTRVDPEPSGQPPETDWERDYRLEYQREQAEARRVARREAARGRAERRAKDRMVADLARQERARREAAERDRRQAERVAAEQARRLEEARRQGEAADRGTGVDASLAPVRVPFPRLEGKPFPWAAEPRADSAALIELPPATSGLLGTVGKSLRDVPRKVGETFLTLVAEGAGDKDAKHRLEILQVNQGLADDAVAQVQTALRLMQQNYPEPQTSAFLASSSSRGLKVLVSSLSDVPEHAVVLAPADEEELGRAGSGFWRWMTGSPPPQE